MRFQYECHDASGQWWRSYGNEQWEFDAEGYMRRREASINDVRDRRVRAPHPRSAPGVRARRPAAAGMMAGLEAFVGEWTMAVWASPMHRRDA